MQKYFVPVGIGAKVKITPLNAAHFQRAVMHGDGTIEIDGNKLPQKNEKKAAAVPESAPATKTELIDPPTENKEQKDGRRSKR